MEQNLREQISAFLNEDGKAVSPKQLSGFLAEIRPEDIAPILSDFNETERNTLIRHLDDASLAQVLDETDPQTTEEILEKIDMETLGQIIELTPPDEGADLVEQLTEKEQEKVLKSLSKAYADKLRKLLKYDSKSAGGIMTPFFARTLVNSTASQALNNLQGNEDLEFLNYIYVVDAKGHLKGVLSLRQLLQARGYTPIKELMETDLISVPAETDQEKVTQLVDQYNLQAIPVLENEVLTGIITFDDVVDVMVDEASEDIYRLSGSSHMHPTKEVLFYRVITRMPWLLIPLIGGFTVAVIQSGFENVIINKDIMVLLMLFTPAVIGMSGGVGLQSSTTIVRGLATGEIDLGRSLAIAGKEILVGILITLCCSLLFVVTIWFLSNMNIIGTLNFPPLQISCALTVGLICGMFMGAVTGTLVPLFCERIGVDPAFVAGPFTTTVNDVVGTTCYFAIALSILGI